MPKPAPNPSQAEALYRAGRFAEAAEAFRRLVAASPGNLSFQRACASAMTHSGKPKDARAMLRRALRIAPTNHELLAELTLTSLALGDVTGAEEASGKAMHARPGDPNVRMVRALALRASARDDEAYDLVARDIAAGSLHPPTVQVFMELCLWKNDPAPGIDAGRRALDASSGGHNDARLRLAYAQLLERAGEYDLAFAEFERLHRMRGGAAGFDADAFDALVDRVRTRWTPESVAPLAEAVPRGDAGDLAVFIVGMPRSGSSLVERVLDRHPEVVGCGEIPTLQETVIGAVPEAATGAMAGLPVVQDPDLLTPARAERVRRGYLRQIRKLGPEATRLTDKSLSNFLHVGPIRAAMPGATVVHCLRDPLDTCVSCYCQDFASPTPFTRDLRVLGRFYNAYRRLMDHWASVIPSPPTEVVYERVVADPEREAHRLIEAVDLAWDEACARPHEGGGYTATASRDQVRRRVYTTSVGRWKRYEKHLGPLMETLER
jgi:hypothetical protein